MSEAGPVRTCIGCRGTDAQARLSRFTLEPSGRLRADGRRRREGRGAYLHRVHSCVEAAVGRGSLDRAFRRRTLPVDVARLWGTLAQAADRG